MINKCHYWQLTMNYYYDIMCIMLEMAWITLQCTERLCSASVQGNKHFSRGQAVRFMTSDPAHCHGGGRSLSVSCGSVDSSPCSEHSALRLATSLSRCFSANLRHQVLNWNFLAHETVAENRTSAQTGPDSLACRGPQQFPANLFVLYCTHQVPVSHHPFPL